MFWYIWFFSLSWLDTEDISWAVFERKTVQTTIAMHHVVMRSFPSEAIEHCSRKWIPLNWKIYSLEVLKKPLTENKDNLAIMCSNLEKNKNIQKLVDAVYERCNTAMGEYWMRFMKILIFYCKMWTYAILVTRTNISRVVVLYNHKCSNITIMIMEDGCLIIGWW